MLNRIPKTLKMHRVELTHKEIASLRNAHAILADLYKVLETHDAINRVVRLSDDLEELIDEMVEQKMLSDDTNSGGVYAEWIKEGD